MKILRNLLIIVALLVAAFFAFMPIVIERSAMGVTEHAPYAIRQDAAAFHERLVIGDLHSDSLLWHRDLLARGTRGHVDFPRLREGNVALQVFSVPTKVPRKIDYESNSGEDLDLIQALAVVQRWPRATWSSLTARALHAADRLHGFAEASPEAVRVLRTSAQLDALLAERAAGGNAVGAVLALEGAHAFDARVKNIDVLYDAGYRMVGLQHFFDNELGGSLHGEAQGGLSAFGRQVVATLDAKGMMIDVAHSSPAVVEDVLAATRSPVVVSHTGVRGACDHPRNIPDALMKRIAAGGGLVGIGYWDAAVCDITPAGTASAIQYAVEILGADHVALGSDYDGGTTVAFDTSELAALTQALLEAGLSRETVRAVMGGNLARFLRNGLP